MYSADISEANLWRIKKLVQYFRYIFAPETKPNSNDNGMLNI